MAHELAKKKKDSTEYSYPKDHVFLPSTVDNVSFEKRLFEHPVDYSAQRLEIWPGCLDYLNVSRINF